MATWYVDDTASGTNAGTSWTNAWTSLKSSETGAASAGDTVLVASTHDESDATTYNPDWVNGTRVAPILVISTNTADDTYLGGAKFHVTGAGNQSYNIAGNVKFYGMTLGAEIGQFFACDNSGEDQSYEDCTITSGSTYDIYFVDSGINIVDFTSCTFLMGDQLRTNGGDWCEATFRDCDFQKVGATTTLFHGSLEKSTIVTLEGCDLTDWDTIIAISPMETQSELTVSQCVLKSSFALTSGTFSAGDAGQMVTLERSHSDTDLTGPKLGLQEQHTIQGVTKALLTKYRTNGAHDGEQANEHSWEMVTVATTLEFHNPMYSPWCVYWLAGGEARTLTFHIAGGATLQNDDFWIELFSPDETSASTTMADYRTSRMANPLATPANLTTDTTSTWNGTGVGTKQEIAFTFTPDQPGPVKFRACLAKPSTTVYFDPLVVVT